jgi:hypothetical protein
VIWGLIAKADVTKRVLDDRFEDVGRLHTNLLGKAAVISLSVCCLHVELVYHDFEDVEVLDLQITEQLCVCSIRCIQFSGAWSWADRSTLLFVDLLKETATAIVKFDDLLRLKGQHVRLIASFLLSVVAFIHHVRVIDTSGSEDPNLATFLLVLEHSVSPFLIAQKHLHLVYLVLFKLG